MHIPVWWALGIGCHPDQSLRSITGTDAILGGNAPFDAMSDEKARVARRREPTADKLELTVERIECLTASSRRPGEPC
jgi:hypothetical protein